MTAVLVLLRPRQWTKNLLLLVAPFFGERLDSLDAVARFLPYILLFCMASSAVYILNDVMDRDLDRGHPAKKNRPIAAGKITPATAMPSGILLALLAAAGAFSLLPRFGFYLLAYILLQVAYSLFLKHMALLDIFAVAAGFLLRIYAGAAIYHVQVSAWLFVTGFLAALLLAAGKRLGETVALAENAGRHRPMLADFSAASLDSMVTAASAATLIAYGLYTVEQAPSLVFTVPLVTFGLFRYGHLARSGMGDPTEAVFTDRALGACALLWVAAVIGLRLFFHR